MHVGGGEAEALEDACSPVNVEGTALSAGEVHGPIQRNLSVKEVVEEMLR